MLNSEKEKLQLRHEENEFREQLKVLNERLNHLSPAQDENAGMVNYTRACAIVFIRDFEVKYFNQHI